MGGKLHLVPAADYLRWLLVGVDRYRARWAARSRRQRGSPNVRAVSAVLVDYLWANPASREPASSDSMRDRVSRALRAEVFTLETANLFGDAFGMDAGHRAKLVDLLAADDAAQFGRLWRSESQRSYRTVSLMELHTLGPDGVPIDHETVHTIEVANGPVSSHTYTIDTDEVEVSGLFGAEAGPLVANTDFPGFWNCAFDFAPPLSDGEVRVFSYRTKFRYRQRPEPSLRRGSQFPLDSLSLRVAFHPDCPPSEVWWCSWSDPYGAAERLDRAELGADGAAARFVRHLEGVIVGFVWSWPDGSPAAVT